MYLPKDASRSRSKEAQKARENRAEIVRALSHGQISRRELFKWGLFTGSGLLAWKNGLNVYAPSAYGQVPTGTPRSPLYGARKFTQPFRRLNLQTPIPLTKNAAGEAVFPIGLGEANAKRLSYHNDFDAWKAANSAEPTSANPYCNPMTKRGPMEGRPPGELFAHQRWDEFFPKVGYVLSLGEIDSNYAFHPNLPFQARTSVWTYGKGKFSRGTLGPPLFKGRYGEPILTRVYNGLQDDVRQNGGFGRNEHQLHFHNAHNGAESDGA